jgi:hypothetical protein
MFTTTYADPIMKEVILPGVREYLNTATVALKYAERETQASPTGEFLVVHNREMNNNAASGRGEDTTTAPTSTDTSASLPWARSSRYARSTVPTMQLYTRASWTGKVVAATKSKDSLVNALVEETKRATIKSKSSVNRQILGDGRDALCFYVSGATATSGVVAGEHSLITGNVSADYLDAGDTYVDLIDAGDPGIEQSLYIRRGAVGATGRAVTFFDVDGVAVALDAQAAAGDYFVLHGTSGSSASALTRRQLMGLQGIIEDGNTPIEGAAGLQGLPVATYPEFVAYVSGDFSSPVDLAVKDMQAVLGELDIISGGDEGGADGIKLILTSQPGYETVAELFRTERIQVRDLELDGGFTGIAFNGRLPIVADKHCQRGAFYFWNPSSTKLFTLQDWDWEDADGSMFYRLRGGDADALGATLKAYMEFGVIQRNANAALIGRQMIR